MDYSPLQMAKIGWRMSQAFVAMCGAKMLRAISPALLRYY